MKDVVLSHIYIPVSMVCFNLGYVFHDIIQLLFLFV